MSAQRVIDWNHLANDLALNCETYHNDYYEGKKFSGPSLHFHRRALTATVRRKGRDGLRRACVMGYAPDGRRTPDE